MKLKTLLSVALLGLSTSAFAQSGLWVYDSVSMGAGYANDVYYNLDIGTNTPHSGSDWDLGFQMPTVSGRDASFNASIRANHVKRAMEVYVLRDSASYNWNAITAADTVGKTDAAKALINNDTSWATGALYQNRIVTDPFSYGWGSYSLGDHSITGDLVYLLKVNGVAYKFWMQKYVSQVVASTDTIGYTFRVAKLDGSDDQFVRLKVQPYADRLFAYYDIANNTILNREPMRNTWDMVFTQYRQIIPAGPGMMLPYNLTGVLTNMGTEVADIRHLNPDDVNAANYKTMMGKYGVISKHADEIGADWKTYVNPGPNGYYQLDDSASYVVKSKNTFNYWQFQFIRFDGGSATGMGKILFRKRYLGTALGVSNVNQGLNAFLVSPNPAAAAATVMVDAKKAGGARLTVTDMAGRVLQTSSLDLKGGVNAYSLNTAGWPAGVYALQIAGQDWKMSSRLVVVH